jgi:hypothetical protein
VADASAGFIAAQHQQGHPDGSPEPEQHVMRALFIGGTIDNSEMDIDGAPPVHYPASTGAGRPRYRLHQLGKRDGEVAYAVYAAPEMDDKDVQRIVEERDYARRFLATPVLVER